MGFLARSMFGGGSELKSADQTLELFKQVFGTNASNTGDRITWKRALEVSTVLACVRVIANGISQVPLKLYRESGDGRKRVPAKDHKLYRVLHRRPNPWQTSFEYRRMLAMHVALTGNHFSYKNFVGNAAELLPFEPGQVTVTRLASGDLTYTVTMTNGETQVFPQEVIWHVRGPSMNGWMGLEATHYARESIGLALATERKHAKMHGAGVSTNGVYSIEGTLNGDQHKQLRKFIKDNYTGPDNEGMPMVLDRNAKWLNQAMTGVDSQHLETRRFQIEEICREFGVMPIMAGYSDKATTYASAEQMFLAHVVHCLAPWYEAIEQSIDVNLLTEKDDRDGIYAKFTEEGLLRGSIKDTSEVLDKYVNGGLMTPNEGRAKLELDADSDPASDKLRIPANIVGKNPNDPAADSEVVGSPAKPKPVPQGGAVVVQDDQAKGFNMLDLAKAMEVAFSKVSINVQPAQIKVDVAQPAIHVTTPDVTFNAPAINIAPAAVTVNIPEQQPHVVNAPVTVNLPEQQAPVVNIAATEINVQPAEVSVTTPVVQVAPPQVNVTVEKGGEVRFTEDDEGNITGAVMQ